MNICMRNLKLQPRVEFIMASSDTVNTPGSLNPMDWLSYKWAKKPADGIAQGLYLSRNCGKWEGYWEFRDVCACMLLLQLCLTLWDPMDFNPPGSSVYGILWARILEWVAIFLPQGIFAAQGSNYIACIGRQILYHWATWEVRTLLSKK